MREQPYPLLGMTRDHMNLTHLLASIAWSEESSAAVPNPRRNPACKTIPRNGKNQIIAQQVDPTNTPKTSEPHTGRWPRIRRLRRLPRLPLAPRPPHHRERNKGGITVTKFVGYVMQAVLFQNYLVLTFTRADKLACGPHGVCQSDGRQVQFLPKMLLAGGPIRFSGRFWAAGCCCIPTEVRVPKLPAGGRKRPPRGV
jgi:hypothetical protein